MVTAIRPFEASMPILVRKQKPLDVREKLKGVWEERIAKAEVLPIL